MGEFREVLETRVDKSKEEVQTNVSVKNVLDEKETKAENSPKS